MRHYELVVVLSPTLSQEEATGAWDRIKGLITENGGEITQEEQWGMRRLAYPIRKAGETFLEGSYLHTRFSTDTSVPIELETHLGMAESVLRSLVVRSEAAKPAPPTPEVAVTAEAAESQPSETRVALAEEPKPEEPVPTAVEEPAVALVEEPNAEEPSPTCRRGARGRRIHGGSSGGAQSPKKLPP